MSRRRTTPDSFEAYIVYKDDIAKYVGITIRGTAIRWREHQKINSQNTALANAMRKYGADQFSVCHVASSLNSSDLAEVECVLISQYNTMSPHGYNLKEGGTQNFRFSDETRARMSARQIGKSPSDQTRQKLSVKARGRKQPPLSQESIAKGAAARTGKKYGPLSEQRRANISAALAGKPGHPASPETREKIAASKRGKPGRPHTLETRALLSAQRQGVKRPSFSIEARLNMSVSAKARWRRAANEVQIACQPS